MNAYKEQSMCRYIDQTRAGLRKVSFLNIPEQRVPVLTHRIAPATAVEDDEEAELRQLQAAMAM